MREGKTETAIAAARPEVAGFVLAGGQSSRMGQDKALLLFAGRPLVAHAISILRQAGLPAFIAGARPSARTSLEAFSPVVEDAEPGLGPLAGICAALASTSARYAVFLPVDLPLLPPSLIGYLLHHARITGRAVTVPTVAGFDQTFPVVLDRALLPALKAALERNPSNSAHLQGARSGLYFHPSNEDQSPPGFATPERKKPLGGRKTGDKCPDSAVGARSGGCFSAFQAAAASVGQPISRVAVELLAQSGQVTHPLGLPPVRWFLNLNTPSDVEQAEALSRSRIA